MPAFDAEFAEEAAARRKVLSGIVFKAPAAAPVVVVEKRSCVRCSKPVEGDRCPACRAHQSSYGGAS
jgi:hypothetical protein